MSGTSVGILFGGLMALILFVASGATLIEERMKQQASENRDKHYIECLKTVPAATVDKCNVFLEKSK